MEIFLLCASFVSGASLIFVPAGYRVSALAVFGGSLVAWMLAALDEAGRIHARHGAQCTFSCFLALAVLAWWVQRRSRLFWDNVNAENASKIARAKGNI